MARYNEILVGRYNRALQKMFSMKGEPPAPQLASEITPNISLFYGVEHRFTESWNRWSISAVQVAVAANVSMVRFRNPSTSNAIAVLEKIMLVNQVADVIRINNQATNVDLSSIGGTQRLDARQGNLSASVIIVSNQAVGGPSGNSMLPCQVQANTTFDVILYENQELTVLPGECLEFSNITVNNALRVTMMWRERFLEDSERS